MIAFNQNTSSQRNSSNSSPKKRTTVHSNSYASARARQMKGGMVRTLFLGLPWIQALYIICFCLTFFFHHSTEAKCQVTTKHGEDMVLGTGPFPDGLYYDQINDRFVCEYPWSCEKYNITGCKDVRCEQEHACQGARFSHINYLRCHGYDSCANTTITDTEMMHCGPRQTTKDEVYRTFCERAKVHIDGMFLNCIGPGSCYAPWWKDRMIVNVGSNATVSCGSSSKNQKACGNMIIEVSHAKRACYATDWYQTCALFCETEMDCDTTDIQFRVVYEDEDSGT